MASRLWIKGGSASEKPIHIYLLKIKVDQVDEICATDLHLINLAKRRIVIFRYSGKVLFGLLSRALASTSDSPSANVISSPMQL
jgi:hypothetical protein